MTEIETCLIKTRFAEACKRIGQAVPEAATAENLDGALAVAGRLGYPLLLKPKSHLVVGMHERGCVVESATELREKFKPYAVVKEHEPIAERYPECAGRYCNASYLRRASACTASAASRMRIAASLRRPCRAEPQEGPTEYKLHLLLRPRRNYSSSSTGVVTSGAQLDEERLDTTPPVVNDSNRLPAYAKRHRQNRLEHLTTQLLWRLQQSSPYHTSSTGNLILPKLPEARTSLESPARPSSCLWALRRVVEPSMRLAYQMMGLLLD